MIIASKQSVGYSTTKQSFLDGKREGETVAGTDALAVVL